MGDCVAGQATYGTAKGEAVPHRPQPRLPADLIRRYAFGRCFAFAEARVRERGGVAVAMLRGEGDPLPPSPPCNTPMDVEKENVLGQIQAAHVISKPAPSGDDT